MQSRRTPPLEKVCLGGPIHVIDGRREKRMLSGGRNPLGIFCSISLSSFSRGPNFSSLLLTSSFQIRGRGGANFPHVKRRRRVGSKEALPSLPWAIKISSPRCESLSVAVICLAGGWPTFILQSQDHFWNESSPTV